MNVSRNIDPDEIGFDPARLARLDTHFGRYVDAGQLAGWQIVVTRRGQIAHSSTYGLRDVEAGAPVQPDTLWRIYSMTKPVTSVAAMILWEEGRFELTDEISRWLPEFADVRVYSKGSSLKPYTVPAIEPIRVWHLLTHTAGLTYGFMQTSVVDGLYRAAGYDNHWPEGVDLATASAALAELPLLFQPGAAWGYSVATDLLGRLIEVISGQQLDDFLADRIFRPLGMTDTQWWVEGDDAERLGALYVPDPRTGRVLRHDQFGDLARQKPSLLAGGSGLISSAYDYHRFTQMLLRGGELDGVRLLGPRTVRFMTRNHLPGGQDLGALSVGGFAETVFEGIGFGLGFAVVQDPVPSRLPSSVGEYYWGGVASTAFWVDPVEEVTTMLFTQLMPSSVYPLRPQLRQLVYSALVD
ncbi:serine hydrolase [Micromonospora sp. WMMD882]|uniref:serine hydrolase domain-containing protein n=1 Tax=Micromonospora sp. WMMD882 TaxID=3015151 RepID=UPI00248D3304|nr:serine hydrolase domain-containing protein [Micromonospora sp. WMMD882]WBB82208.1 serine hydrolase [Micromonospora sp. WMMD882]